MLILLPPSEGKPAPRRGKALDLGGLSAPSLTPARERVLDALVGLCAGDPDAAAAVLGVPETQLELVDAQRRACARAPTARADAVYTGVLYDALGLGDPVAGARRRATSRVRVTSSLFGLVAPTDRIPAYRLSGDAVLPGLGTVAGVWREELGPEIAELVGDGLLVDLRSGMYAAFWRPGRRCPGSPPSASCTRSRGRRQVVSHFNKATKGRIVRALLEDGANPRTPARLAEALRDLGWTVEVAPGAKGGRPARRGGRRAVTRPGDRTSVVDDPDDLRGRLAVLLGTADEQPPPRGDVGGDLGVEDDLAVVGEVLVDVLPALADQLVQHGGCRRRPA